VIYFTTLLHNDNYKMPAIITKQTLAYANTREKLPEASLEGPGSKNFMALAGLRPFRTLSTQGHASRPPKFEKQQTEPETKTLDKENLT
jgi:hypothetical protein